MEKNYWKTRLIPFNFSTFFLISKFSFAIFRSVKPHPHKELYTSNLTLINMSNFKFLINNDVCNVTPIEIVTVVHTATENKKARDIIRCQSVCRTVQLNSLLFIGQPGVHPIYPRP